AGWGIVGDPPAEGGGDGGRRRPAAPERLGRGRASAHRGPAGGQAQAREKSRRRAEALTRIHARLEKWHAAAPERSSKQGRTTMKRIALIAASAVLWAGAASAQQAPIDWDKIQIKTTDLGNKTYRLEGQGGNITVAVGTDGIIMVDGQFPQLSDKIKAAIAAISPLPIKYLINTHFHGDHTGGNENFAKSGTTIVAQDNIRVRLAAGTTNGITGNKTPPQPAMALPTDTYIGGTKTVEVGGRKAQLTHVTNAHTDGDTWVYFADANVLCTGDTSNNT